MTTTTTTTTTTTYGANHHTATKQAIIAAQAESVRTGEPAELPWSEAVEHALRTWSGHSATDVCAETFPRLGSALLMSGGTDSPWTIRLIEVVS